jgi:hypothetical protein
LIQTQYYHLIDAIIYFLGAIIPVYFILKSKGIDRKYSYLKNLSAVLASFVLIQGFYHIAGGLQFTLLAKGILEPFSLTILLFFAIIYFIYASKFTKRSLPHVRN